MDDDENEFNAFAEIGQKIPMMSSDEPTCETGLKTGINYCKYLSEQMQNEVTAWEEKLDFVRQTNRKLKQNVMDLDTEKQSMIMKFEEEFRKYGILNTYVNKLDQEIAIIKDYFEKTLGLEADIQHSENEEQRILNRLWNMFEEYLIQFQTAENNLTAEKENLEENCNDANRKIEENQRCDEINSNLETYIAICEKKIQEQKPLVNFSDTLEGLKKRIHTEQTMMGTTVTELKQKTDNLLLQLKQEIDVVRLQARLIRDRVKNECIKLTTTQEEVKSKLENLKLTNDNLIQTSFNQETVIEKLRELEKGKKVKLMDWLEKRDIINEEVKLKSNILNELKTIIQSMEYRQQELLQKKEKIEEDIKSAKAKKENLRENLEKFKEFNSLINRYESLKEKKLFLVEKGNNLDATLGELSHTNAQLIERINETKYQIQNEDQQVNNLKILAEEDDNQDILETSEDSELLETQLGIEVEENSMNELYNSEIDSLYEQFHEILSKFTDSETELSQIKREGFVLQNEMMERKESLRIMKEKHEFCNNSIQKIKQNVYQGNYVTMQELNKKLNTMVNGKNVETERVAKLKNEISNLEDRLKSKRGILKLEEIEEESLTFQPLIKSNKTRKISSSKVGDETRRKKKIK